MYCSVLYCIAFLSLFLSLFSSLLLSIFFLYFHLHCYLYCYLYSYFYCYLHSPLYFHFHFHSYLYCNLHVSLHYFIHLFYIYFSLHFFLDSYFWFTVYRERRGVLANLALGFQHSDLLPIVKYTDDENNTWGLVYDKLQASQRKFACSEYLAILPLMESECGYCRNEIPQVRVKFAIVFRCIFFSFLKYLF